MIDIEAVVRKIECLECEESAGDDLEALVDVNDFAVTLLAAPQPPSKEWMSPPTTSPAALANERGPPKDYRHANSGCSK